MKTFIILILALVGSSVSRGQEEVQEERSEKQSLPAMLSPSSYQDIDWEDLRRGNPGKRIGVIDGFLLVKKLPGDTFQITLYETLEALEYNRPRRNLEIPLEFFISEVDGIKKEEILSFHKKWIRVTGVFNVAPANLNWTLAHLDRCDFVQWWKNDGDMETRPDR